MDQYINQACKTTPIDHHIWTYCLNQHDTIREIQRKCQLNPVSQLLHLLQEWNNLMSTHNTPGPYISPSEQVKYVEVIQKVWQPIDTAILEHKFEPCFEANNIGIGQTAQRNRSSFVFLLHSFLLVSIEYSFSYFSEI